MVHGPSSALSRLGRTAVFALGSLTYSVVHANELVVETFENLDFGFNSRSIHQLISASVVIAVISVILVVSIVLFRCYMIHCRNYRNIRRYQLPTQDAQQNSQKSLLDRYHSINNNHTNSSSKSGDTIPRVPTPNGFHAVFTGTE
ncbi:hypothetical protein AAVH_01210 [Aphelenchoides avenae]|nr:hypothetical protein AAVH_01210 [Aphelenchus avenae]